MLKLEALYDFTTDESNILIHHSEVEICINQNTYVGDGEVRLELIPKAKIHFYGHFQGVPAQDALGISVNQTQISSFSINGCQIEGFHLKSGGDVISQQFNLQWSPKREPINVIGNNSSQMTFLIFHLFNFKDFVGTRRSIEQVESETYSIEHVDLICNKWNIELKSLRSTQDNIIKLKEKGGYRLTHIGGIKKTDGTLFTGEDAADCLEAVSFFLSFAKGAWCVPICAVGFDTSDNRVWASWASPNASWQVPFSWFDPHNGIQLTSFFTSFINKIENSEWYEALHEVVYWYLNANNSSEGSMLE